jgi:nitrous oxide reductase accessory protein NosL
MTLMKSARFVAVAATLAIVAAACGSSTETAQPKATSTTKAPSTTTADAMDGMDHGHDGEGEDHDAAVAKGHHHDDSTITYDKLPAKTKAEVDAVITWAKKYKTGADAKKDGWIKATKSLYGIGSHWLKGGVTGFATGGATFDITTPNVLLFDGEGDDAKLAGVSWILGTPTNPEGFTGPDDSWHRHSSVCFLMKEFLVISEGEAEGSPINLSAASCKDQGGTMFPISNLTMMHLWIGDGYITTGPIFAHDHPLLLDGYKPHESV